jgi:hypothetical protein
MQIPSAFLPRVSYSHDEAYIAEVFWAYFGTEQSPVSRVDLIPKEDPRTGQMYAIAFVHFHEEVEETPEVSAYCEKMAKNDSVKLVHSYPWYWIIRKNTSSPAGKKTQNRPRVLSEKDEASIKEAQQAYIASRNEKQAAAAISSEN